MSAVADPVAIGVAASLGRPGTNVTGLSSVVSDLETKRIEYLKEIAPDVKRIAFLGDFRNANLERQWEEVQIAALSLRIDARKFDIRSAADVSRALQEAVGDGVQAVRVGLSGSTRSNRKLIVDLATRHKLPSVYAAREFAEAGGLLSYATDYTELYSRAASFVDKILKGASPADLPI